MRDFLYGLESKIPLCCVMEFSLRSWLQPDLLLAVRAKKLMRRLGVDYLVLYHLYYVPCTACCFFISRGWQRPAKILHDDMALIQRHETLSDDHKRLAVVGELTYDEEAFDQQGRYLAHHHRGTEQ